MTLSKRSLRIVLAGASCVAGATFSTDIPWYTSVDGPMLIVALSGDLIVQPAGPARVYRDGAAATESPAGTPVILGPNDAIAFSSRATATGGNPGSEPVRALYGIAGVYDDAMANSIVDAHDVIRVDINYETHLILPDEGASLAAAAGSATSSPAPSCRSVSP